MNSYSRNMSVPRYPSHPSPHSPVMLQQCQRHGDEGCDEVDGEDVLGAPGAGQLDQVEEEDGGGDDDRLAHLHPVDARQDVDGVGAEHGQHAHVDIVEDA